MKVILAQNAGFCFGVNTAIVKIAHILDRTPSVIIDGEIIHNPETVQILQSRGLTIDKNTDAIKNKVVAIRTHGTTIEDLDFKRKTAAQLVNLTCPKVSQVQAVIKKYAHKGYHVLIAGDDRHPEVISLKSYATQGFTVIHDSSGIRKLNPSLKYILVAQTTFDNTLFKEIQNEVLSNLSTYEIFNTICDSTLKRQNEVEEAINKGSDTVIIIGGRNSANTKSLADIAERKGARTFHIENADEFKPEFANKARTVFITAGASTPRWAIDNVLEKLFRIKIKRLFSPLMYLYLLLQSNIFRILSATAATACASHVFTNNTAFSFEKTMSAAALTFSLLLSSHISSKDSTQTRHVVKRNTVLKTILFIFAILTPVLLLFVREIPLLTVLLLFILASLGLVFQTLSRKLFTIIPRWTIFYLPFIAGTFIVCGMGPDSSFFSTAISAIPVLTVFILMCSPSEILNIETDIITGQPSVISRFGFTAYRILLLLLISASCISSLLFLKQSYSFSLFILLSIIPLYSTIRRPVYRSPYLILQLLAGIIFSTIYVLFK